LKPKGSRSRGGSAAWAEKLSRARGEERLRRKVFSKRLRLERAKEEEPERRRPCSGRKTGFPEARIRGKKKALTKQEKLEGGGICFICLHFNGSKGSEKGLDPMPKAFKRKKEFRKGKRFCLRLVGGGGRRKQGLRLIKTWMSLSPLLSHPGERKKGAIATLRSHPCSCPLPYQGKVLVHVSCYRPRSV